MSKTAFFMSKSVAQTIKTDRKTTHRRIQSHSASRQSHFSVCERLPGFQKQLKNYRNQKIIQQINETAKSLLKNRTKLNSFMQIYQIVKNSNQVLRCFQHNNDVSLYCKNERKILCVNCLYGMHKHKTHKVIPLRNCLQFVQQDNQKLDFIIEKQIQKADDYTKIAHQNQNFVQRQMKKIQKQIEQQFLFKANQLKSKFQLKKKQLKQAFVPIIDQCKNVIQNLQQFRLSLWRINTIKACGENQQSFSITHHLLCSNAIQQCDYKTKKIEKNDFDKIIRHFHKPF